MTDVISFGPDRPRRPPRLLLVAGLVAMAGIVLAAIAVLATRDPEERRPTSLPATTAAVPPNDGAPPPGAGPLTVDQTNEPAGHR